MLLGVDDHKKEFAHVQYSFPCNGSDPQMTEFPYVGHARFSLDAECPPFLCVGGLVPREAQLEGDGPSSEIMGSLRM